MSSSLPEQQTSSQCYAAAASRAKRRKLAQATEEASDPQAKDRREATVALRDAMLGTDQDTLFAAVQWATSVGVAADALEAAKKRLEALTLAPQRRKECEAATIALQLAMHGSDASVLAAAIARAEETFVPAELIERARLRRVTLETARLAADEGHLRQVALEELQAATAGSNLQAIVKSLTRAAYLGVPKHQLEPAFRRRAELENAQKEKAKSQAAQALEAAVASGDIAELASAIDKAASGGVDPQSVLMARARLQELRQRGQQKAGPPAGQDANAIPDKTAAGKALAAAVAGSDLQALLQAMTKAIGAGVDGMELWKAQQRRTVLEAQLRERLLQTFAPGV